MTAEDLEPVKAMLNDNPLTNKDEQVIEIGVDSITRQDMTRLQGPHKPSQKADRDLWLCDTNINCLVNILNQKYHQVYQDKDKAVFFGKVSSTTNLCKCITRINKKQTSSVTRIL